jgi:hypothetical protein
MAEIQEYMCVKCGSKAKRDIMSNNALCSLCYAKELNNSDNKKTYHPPINKDTDSLGVKLKVRDSVTELRQIIIGQDDLTVRLGNIWYLYEKLNEVFTHLDGSDIEN